MQADEMVTTILGKWRNRRPAVLGSGLRLERQEIKANESQFLESMTKAAADIAISFNLPPAKIGASISGANVTYQNLETAQAAWLMESMNPDLVIVQEVLERQTPRTQTLRWQTGAFLRSDLKTRYESYSTGIGAGFLTANEARAWEDLPPLPPVADSVRSVEQDMRSADHVMPEARQDPIYLPAPVVNVAAPVVNVNVDPTPVTVELHQDPVVIPAPVVNVDAPVINVNVEPTPVTVDVAAPAVQVDVTMPEPAGKTELITFERDAKGNIIGAVKGSL
jgi:hypothetical protein